MENWFKVVEPQRGWWYPDRVVINCDDACHELDKN
jgi:hypothetical protein